MKEKNHSLLDLWLWKLVHSSKRWKKTLLIHGKFFLRCIVFEFLFFFLKIFTFFVKFSQVAILKLEHCGLFYLVAYGCLHNSLYFESDLLDYFWKKKLKNQIFSKNWILVFEKSMDEAQNSRNEKPKIQGFVLNK